MQITNRRLRLIYVSLTALSGRTLPTITSDLKVARRLRELRGLFDDTEVVMRKIREQRPAPEGLEEHELPVALKEARQLPIDVMLDELVDIPDFTDAQKIAEIDLPKALKTGLGEENRAGIADIVLNLDLLYAALPED